MSKKKTAKFTDMSGSNQRAETNKSVVGDCVDVYYCESTPPVESELEKDIDIELAGADTHSILTCLKRKKIYYEDSVNSSVDTQSKELHSKGIAMIMEIKAKIRTAKKTTLASAYTVRLTFWELDYLLGATEYANDFMQGQTRTENRSVQIYNDTIKALYDLLLPAYIARYAAIWPNSNANLKSAL